MNEQIIIRKEVPDDYQRVFELTEKAFETMEISDHNEGKLVENLRKSDMFISDLSLVAEQNKQVVGHVLFTPVLIDNGQELFESLTLAPVSVLPEYQNCLLYTSDAADEEDSVDLGGRRIIKKKKKKKNLTALGKRV